MAIDADGVRERLLEERAATERQLQQLLAQFDDIVEAVSDVSNDDEHDPEGSTIAYERSRTAALADQARDHLADIDLALQRLEAGTYEICEVCGGPIAEPRLLARPTARRCINCAARR